MSTCNTGVPESSSPQLRATRDERGPRLTPINLRTRCDNHLSWVIVASKRARRRPPSPISQLPTEPVCTDFAQVTLVPEAGASHRVTVFLDGVPSSHIDLIDATHLEFKYMQWMAAMIDAWFDRDAGVRALHLGGAACTMARYIAATRPSSHQLALELDASLARLVRQWFDLPRSPQLRIRVQDARVALTQSTDSRWDVIIRDAFLDSAVPHALTTLEAVEHVHRALSADGIYLANCADYPPLPLARREVATLRELFGAHVLIAAEPGIFAGRRHGNVIIMAAKDGQRLRRVRAQVSKGIHAAPAPARVLAGHELAAFSAGAHPFRDL